MNSFCLVVDDEPSIQEYLSSVLTKANVASASCSTVDAMLSALSLRQPELIFLDAALEGSDAVDAMRRLALFGYKGAVQLISGRAPDILEELCQIGQEYGLKMRTPLQKPFSAAQVRHVLKREGFISEAAIDPPLESIAISPLKGCELWCKPLFDVQRQTLALVEARVRAKVSRIDQGLDSGRDVPADAEALLSILNFCRQQVASFNDSIASVGVPLAVVVPCLVSQLARINIASFAGTVAPSVPGLSWLTVELAEDDVFADSHVARQVMLQLRIHGANIRVRNAGTRLLSLVGYRQLPVQEVTFAAGLTSRTGPAMMKQLSKMVEIIKRTDAKVIAEANAAPPDYAWLGEADFDLYEDAREARLYELAAFVHRWGRTSAPISDLSPSAVPGVSADRRV
jgi:EAL domain-containing protein (putative c-di-GMP-specific phosphodiesterase class I)